MVKFIRVDTHVWLWYAQGNHRKILDYGKQSHLRAHASNDKELLKP